MMQKRSLIPTNAIERNVEKEVEKSNKTHGLLEIPDNQVTFKEISLKSIAFRSINKYSQTNIENLANSIRRTNNRLIHPITVIRSFDLPADSPVRKEIERKGDSIDNYKYILVSGERRLRAFLKNQQEDRDKAGNPTAATPFDTITANILSEEEAKSEEIFYTDSNLQVRQIDLPELIWLMKDALREIDSVEGMIKVREKMLSPYTEELSNEPKDVKAFFRNKNKYLEWAVAEKCGFVKWDSNTLRNYKPVAEKCTDYVADKCLEGAYNVSSAKVISKFDPPIQDELVDLFISDRDAYVKRLEELNDKPKAKVTHKLVRSTLETALKKINTEKDRYEKALNDLGSSHNKYEDEALKIFREFSTAMNKLIEESK